MSAQLQVKFMHLAKMLGKQIGHDLGNWRLDYVSVYGGYIIEETMESGGIHHPLINRRLKKAEMQAALDMALAIKRLEEQELFTKVI